MCKNEIKAILFDLGETILCFGKLNTSEVFRQGARLSYDFLLSCGQPIGGFRRYCFKSLVSLYSWRWFSAITGKDFDALSLLKKVGIKNGIKLDSEKWQHLVWLWYEPLSKIARIEPETKETLTALKNIGLKLGIVSNTFVHRSALEKNLEQLGIMDCFDISLYSYEFKFRKPNTRIFKAAAERIGEKPENIMFVGDRIDNDIKPALKLGIKAVLKTAYTNAGKKIPAKALKINQLCQLPELVRQINTECANCSSTCKKDIPAKT